jgi:8-hydroxy-5-deazaflavin:NADPH oxidoreductase
MTAGCQLQVGSRSTNEDFRSTMTRPKVAAIAALAGLRGTQGDEMKIGIIGSGNVAQALASGLARHGHAVMLGTRDPQRLAAFGAANAGVSVGSVAQAASFAELAVLAVKGTAAAQVLASAAPALGGKTVLDATNPIADAPPVNGVMQYFTGPNESLLERLQRAHPGLHLVKAFSCVGSAHMIDPRFAGGRPTMFIAGNDAAAKATVAALLDAVGWDTADMGGAEGARAIEPLAMLWCIPGLLRNDWAHAFKLLQPA